MSIFWLVIATRVIIPLASAGLVTILLRRSVKGVGMLTCLVVALSTAFTAALLTKLAIIWLRS
jgi:hypothetical protein